MEPFKECFLLSNIKYLENLSENIIIHQQQKQTLYLTLTYSRLVVHVSKQIIKMITSNRVSFSLLHTSKMDTCYTHKAYPNITTTVQPRLSVDGKEGEKGDKIFFVGGDMMMSLYIKRAANT